MNLPLHNPNKTRINKFELLRLIIKKYEKDIKTILYLENSDFQNHLYIHHYGIIGDKEKSFWADRKNLTFFLIILQLAHFL